MPLPILAVPVIPAIFTAGLTALGGMATSFFGGIAFLFGVFFTYLTTTAVKRALFKVVIITLYISLLVTVTNVAIELIFNNIPDASRPYFEYLSYFLPSNAPACMGIVVSAKLIRWLFMRKVELIELFAS